MLFGFVGTVISMVFISCSLFICNKITFKEDDELKLKPIELLLFAAVLWATDPVSVLSVVKESLYPRLNSILFGEGLMNDATSILIFDSIVFMIPTAHKFYNNNKDIDVSIIIVVITTWNFIYLAILSSLLGIFFGLISAFISKYFSSFKHSPQKEVALVILIAYLSYVVSAFWRLSSIITLFAWGITMSHYTYHNISETSKKGCMMAANTLAHAAEAFVFLYLGIGVFTTDQQTYNMKFTILIIISLILSRVASVLLCILMYSYHRNWNINFTWQEGALICLSGIDRGAIPFAMCLRISSVLAIHK